MKLSFLALRNILNAAVIISALVPTMAVGSVIGRDGVPNPADKPEDTSTSIVSHEELMNWIATTDAELTYIGETINSLSSRSAELTTVVYCNRVDGLYCGGHCTVYTGGPICLNAHDTNCLLATHNVEFCSTFNCAPPSRCNSFVHCGRRLNGGFCHTPGTNSIRVLH